MKNQKDYTNHKGFTLVELIVVIVILAILAAILIPGLLKWIDHAKKKRYELEARSIYLATEASLVEVQAQRIEAWDQVKAERIHDVTNVKQGFIMNTITAHQDWLKYIQEKSGIEKVDFLRFYINNGKIEAFQTRFYSPSDGKQLWASIRWTDAAYYETNIKGSPWEIPESWGVWDWSEEGTWNIKEKN